MASDPGKLAHELPVDAIIAPDCGASILASTSPNELCAREVRFRRCVAYSDHDETARREIYAACKADALEWAAERWPEGGPWGAVFENGDVAP